MPKLPDEKVEETIKPYWSTTDGDTVRLYQGNVIDVLRKLPAKSVQMVVTSPPYWALRDYGTAQWEGGDPKCSHVITTTSDPARLKKPVAGCPTRDSTVRLNQNHRSAVVHDAAKYKSPFLGTATTGSPYLEQGELTAGKVVEHRSCPLGCGAVCSDYQLGSEPVPDCAIGGTAKCGECHVCRMVAVFREVKRVLRDDGTVWMDYGDTYGGGKAAGGVFESGRTDGRPGDGGKERWKEGHKYDIPVQTGVRPGNLMGIPWRVALGMQADGWILRQDIIWHKPSVMPESVRNRCTKSHEYVFLFAKNQKYFYDGDAIREPLTPEQAEVCRRTVEDAKKKKRHEKLDAAGQEQVARVDRYAATTDAYAPTSRNKRSVWSIDGDQEVALWLEEHHPEILVELLEQSTNKSDVWKYASAVYDGAHFATFPVSLIEPMIMAGTSEKGACAKCGAPWRRVVSEPSGGTIGKGSWCEGADLNASGRSRTPAKNAIPQDGNRPGESQGWEPGCECHGKFIKRKGTRLGHGSYHDHAEDGVAYGLRQGGRGPASTPGEPTKEFAATIVEYVSKISLDDHPVVPCTVLDIFIGSGTSCAVSLSLGRRSVGIDLNRKYLDNNAIPRIEGALSSRPALARLIPRKTAALAVRGSALRK